MMPKRPLFFVMTVLLILTASSPKQITKDEAFPKVRTERLLAILVLPPLNETTAADAKEYYWVTIAEPMTLSGYYICPIEVVSEIMKNEGIYDILTILYIPP